MATRIRAAGALIGLAALILSPAAASATPSGPTSGSATSTTTAAPATSHDPNRACTTTSGVFVAVDFRFWAGDPVERGCAADPTNGLVALHDAGFTTADDAHDGPGFVCRIDDRPTPGEDGCQNTPFPPHSWSYWHARAGQSTWTFSQKGALDYDPPPGSIDAWVFGNTNPPTFTPAEVRDGGTPGPTTTTTATSSTTLPPSTTTAPVAATSTTTPTTTPTTTRESAPATGATSPTTRPSARSTTTTTLARSRRTTTTRRRKQRPRPRAGKAGTGAGAAHSSESSSPPTTALRIVNAASGPVTGKSSSGSSPVGLLVGLGVVVVLGGAAGATAWRRRRTAG